MIITREIINKNIKIYDINYLNDDLQYHAFEYKDISKLIDLYKNLLIEYGVKPQQSVIIAEYNDIWQLSAIFACFELGLIVVTADYFYDSVLAKLEREDRQLDTKTKILLPIDYCILPQNYNKKGKYASSISNKTIIRNFSYGKLNKNLKILHYNYEIDKSFISVKSSTNGIVDPPKCIEHTHEFLYNLCIRNSKFLSNNYISLYTQNHGNSMFCYAIPALHSKGVTNFYNLNNIHPKFNSIIKFLNLFDDINHIFLPYPNDVDVLLKLSENNPIPNTIIHVITYIKKEWVEKYYSKKYIKNIISNFGSNETTGPIFINQAKNNNFSETSYTLVDNFFQVELKNTEIEVNMPVYNKIILLQDNFEYNKKDGVYLYKGRTKKHLPRINDIKIDSTAYDFIIENYFDAKLVYDEIKAQIYLVIWDHNKNESEEIVLQKINIINNKLLDLSFGMHFISKFDILNWKKYSIVIESNIEEIKEYFRNFVKINIKI